MSAPTPETCGCPAFSRHHCPEFRSYSRGGDEPQHPHQRLIDLARSFPSLRDGARRKNDNQRILPERLTPDADLPDLLTELAAWAVHYGSSAGFQACAFVLEVYNGNAGFDCPDFELSRAIGTWDSAHRAAFAAWAQEPFLC